MTKLTRQTSISILILMCFFHLNAQNTTNFPKFNYSNGIGIVTPDSSFSLNLRFRTQLRAAYGTITENNFSASDIEARVRRLRVRCEGFLINPKLNYYIQLSFSRGDMDWVGTENSALNSSPNVVRDAVVIYKPNEELTWTFGQTKLPGNRQRVISSGDLQFADRSIVNGTFNIDRDFGLQFAYQNKIAQLYYVVRGAISSGEGRNSNISNAGLAYTGRVELLPLGKFTNKGDYFEGDLEREKTPKLSLAAGFHRNERAARTAGTIGRDLYQNRSINAFIADVLLKYQGFALSAEYINRNTTDPITLNNLNQERIIFVGEGKLFQLSYLFKNNFEIAAKYSVVSPYSPIQAKELQREEMGIGMTRYLRKHRVKVQSHLFYNRSTNLHLNVNTSKNLTALFQVELGI
jgi:phosphate-selective porin OprO and OprP